MSAENILQDCAVSTIISKKEWKKNPVYKAVRGCPSRVELTGKVKSYGCSLDGWSSSFSHCPLLSRANVTSR
jgi:hypothetical protein